MCVLEININILCNYFLNKPWNGKYLYNKS